MFIIKHNTHLPALKQLSGKNVDYSTDSQQQGCFGNVSIRKVSQSNERIVLNWSPEKRSENSKG